MRVRIARFICAVASLFIAVVAVQPVWAQLPTPNQPILLVQDSTSANTYQNFVPQLLTTEGLNGFQIAQLSQLTLSFLDSYDVVVLPHLTLTAGEATLFQDYVSAGGTLVGFRPDLQLASVFGVASLGTTLTEGWLQIDTTTPYASALVSNVMKFHGTADLYSLSGASSLATLYNTSTLPTTSPAASINSYGSGQAILFSFDLTQSIVLMRQGNPAWAGYPDDHDGFNTMRAAGMFMDMGSGQFWNDLGDGALNDVPQADIQLRLFSNLVTLSNAAKLPLPKLWYFPNQNRSQLLMTGDDHSFPVADALGEINNIATYGGLFSYNLWYPFDTVTPAQVTSWLAAGNSMGIHFNDTAEVDSSGVGGSAASWAGMQGVMSAALTSFAATYPSAPYPVTTRNHFIIWVSNDANGTADQVAQAKLFQNNGIQLDTSYSSFPNRWGYMTGSGLPMEFLDTVAGTVIPVYEQATQYEDDVQLSTDAYSVDWSVATAQGHYVQSLSDGLTKYNTVITMLFHPESWSSYQNYADAALQYAQAQAIPISTTGSWLSFWQARAATTLSMPSFTSNTLTFTASGAPAGLTLLVPQASGTNKVVSTFHVDGVSQSFTVAAYQGVMYASVVLTSGTHTISVGYTTAGRILGQISPSAAATSTTIQVQGGSITETVLVAANGTYVAGPLPAGTYTVTPVSANYTFSPVSPSVPLGTADVTGVNFTATISGETLFTTQTPVTTNASDGAGVNYELGTAFTSNVAGQITAIRFWKASSESGTHTGSIWSSTGTLLASVTFTNETASGWQRQTLATPLTIAANTTYVVGVNTGGTYYVATTGGLASQVVDGNLSSVAGNNGLYGSTGTFPTSSYEGSNYFRDIVFVPGATYTISGAVSPAVSGATLTLSGAGTATTTSNSSGNYTFSGMANGNYTVTPTLAGFTFNPTSAPADVNGSNVTVTTFVATAVPTYTVSGALGASGSGATVTLTVTASGATVATTTADSNGNYSFPGLGNGNYTVTPTKAGYTFSPTSAPANVNSANVIVATFTVTAIQTLFTSQTPTTVNDSDGSSANYELGMSFTSSVAGQITAVRFWKASSETGTHTGSIWSSTGAPLASVTFTNETASGWQQQLLASPLTIAANTTYVVGVNTGNTYYVDTNGGLTTQIVNGDLSSVVGNNGLYGSTGTFPTSSYEGSNYFRDIVFVPSSITTIAATLGTPQSATIGMSFGTTLQATVMNGSTPVNGATVTFAAPTTGASGTFSGSTTATTNSSGVATAPAFTANTTAGSYTVTASVAGATSPASFTLTNTPGSPSSVAATAGTPQNAAISTAFATALQATVKDAYNNPVSGVSVTFAAPGSGASGTFGASATVTTNSVGVATAPTFTANSTLGSYTVTATVSGLTPASFSLTNTSAPPASVTATLGTPQNVTIGGAFTALQATVKDANSNPVSGVTVTFAAPGSGASGTFGGSTAVSTNSSGVAIAPTFTANTTAGTYTVTASVSGVTTPASFSLTNNPGPAASVTATVGTPQSAAISTAFATALQATVKDASNNPVSGVSVTFAAPGTGASGTFGGTTTIATNSSGVAIAPTFTANSTTGSYTVTASVSGLTSANFSLTNAAAAPISVDVNKSTDRSTSAKTIASPSFSTTATNELLLAFVSTDATGSGTNVSVSSIAGGSLTWTLVERTNTQLGTAEIWRAFSSTIVSSATVTATLSQSVAASITVMSFKGVSTTGTNGSGAIGAVGSGNANPGAPTASLVTTMANSVVIGVGNDWDNAISRTAGANQTIVHQYLATTGDTYWVQEVTTLAPAGATVTVNDTAPTTDRYNLSICEILP